MKKIHGFTLAELLIVLGITGVVAAVMLPLVNNLMPDKTKVAYLKVHDELKRNIQELASNSSLYPVCLENGDDTIGCQEHPLLNTSKPLIKKFESYTGDTKLCKLLAFSMDAEESCKAGDYTYTDTTFAQNLSFTTKNGMQWKIVPQERTIGEESASFQSDIYVDVDPSKKSKNCMYSSTCKQPDRFKFLVAADGSVIPADPMGLMYINTRKSFTKNKNEKTEGDVQNILVSELREFQFKPCTEGSAQIPNCQPGEVWDPTANACVPEGLKKYDVFKGICENIPPHTDFGGINSSDDENTIAHLRFAYEVLSKAYDTAVAKNGEPKTWGLGLVSNYATTQDFLNSQKMFNAMKDGLSIAKDCGGGTGCFASGTDTKWTGESTGQRSIDVAPHRYKIKTEDGMSMSFQAYNGDCKERRYMGNLAPGFGICGKIIVDVDGSNKGPSSFGKDLYTFMLTNDGIVLEGSKEFAYDGYSTCYSKGDWCSAYVLEQCNRNYLHQ